MSRRVTPLPLLRRPSVTVVMPCYNYGHYLSRALTSVLSQAGVDVDVILIDDASPDGSGDVVRAMAAADRRVQPIVHETYNEGLELATGDYVVLLSADDALPAGALSRATALLDAEPSVGFVYGHPVVFADDPPPAPTGIRDWTVWTGEEWIERRCEKGENCIMNPEVVMRTSVQHAIGGYDPALPHSGDLEMWMRAAAMADVGRVNGPGQGYYRVHEMSMQRTVNAGHLADLRGRRDAFAKVLVGPDARVADGARLFATARRSLAFAALGYARLAYEHGRAELEPINEYLAFAEETWPEARHSRQWSAVARRACLSAARLQHGIVWKGRRALTDIENRISWRQRRRSGM
jgi:GT2 family glycosyltransferase